LKQMITHISAGICAILLAACASVSSPLTTSTPSQPPPAATASPRPTIPTAAATNTSSPAETASPAATAQPAAGDFEVCSPLEDISLADLPQIVTNPYDPPPPGQDGGHHGVDLAYYRRGSHNTMVGLPIYSALSGKVASVTLDQPPYGNMVIVETPLQDLPPEFIAQLDLPQQLAQTKEDPRLTCPAPQSFPDLSTGDRSLYILYAHMQSTPAVIVGESAHCGQALGAVGNTGMSGNPHLHFEVRLGPSGVVIGTMSHYNNRATIEEMANYCLWRVSGAFALVDPLKLIRAGVAFSALPTPAP
jgi:murein DD-endopeptidase MepM/ murein hydrolase activator NlpD